MEKALKMARKALRFGEVPIGAVIVREETVIARAHNLTRTFTDPTAHAEILAIRRASEGVGDWRLSGCTLYCTVEPCIMCAGAIVLSRIERLVYGCPDPKMGAVRSLFTLCSDARLNHQVTITQGVLGEAAGNLMQSFFRELRELKA
jgi:tRNA(adenine34) deaminase